MVHFFSDHEHVSVLQLVDKHGHLIQTASKRRVISQSQIVPLLTELYAQPSWKSSSGRDRFYKRIAEQYLGVTRRDVMEFLRRQEVWQLHQRSPFKGSPCDKLFCPTTHWITWASASCSSTSRSPLVLQRRLRWTRSCAQLLSRSPAAATHVATSTRRSLSSLSRRGRFVRTC